MIKELERTMAAQNEKLEVFNKRKNTLKGIKNRLNDIGEWISQLEESSGNQGH